MYLFRAVNYGTAGTLMGHEMSHGYDDQGKRFDKHGAMRDWWNNETTIRFQERARCFVEQYSRLPIPEAPALRVGLTLLW